MRRNHVLAGSLLMAAAFSFTGCCYYELRDTFDECSLGIRNEYLARMAWHRCSDAYDDHPYEKELGHGFRDGYAAVAGGADGCCPSMPPRCYWNTCYRGCEGQARVNAWFDGYARGAIAAEADGLAASGRIVMRPPACPSGCPVPTSSMNMTGVHSLPSHGGASSYQATPTFQSVPLTPPPPAPPSMAPSIPADEAYERYDEGGLYYE